MSRTEQEVRQALAHAAEMPDGDAKIALLEDLVRHADASGSRRLAFDVRMRLTSAYQHGGETGKSFVTFSWCLAAYDRDPGAFTEYDDALLRWHYKWMVSALRRFPDVPLDRSYRALDDMQRRYLAGGHSLHAVYTLRCRVADHVGDLATADEWYRKWCTAPRDANSDCIACDPTNKAYHLQARGRDEEAIAVAAPVLAAEITCSVQPQSMQATLLLPYLRTGQHDAARDAHRRGYRAIRGNRDYLDELAEHLEFCALTGNEARGLEILERHLGWLDRPADPMALLEAAGSGAMLLRRLREIGEGGQRLRRPASGDRPPSSPEAAELEEELHGTALRLAARFDARNGTDHQSRLLAAKLTAEPIVEYLPLSRTSTRRAPSASPTRAAAQPRPPEVAADLTGLTPVALLDRAEEQYAHGREEQARAATRRFDELTAGTDPEPLLAVRRADLRGTEQADAGDVAAAEHTWRAVAERYAELGEEARRQAALGRVGMVCLETGRTAEGVELIEVSAAHLREHGTPRQRARAQLRRVAACHETGRTTEALAVLDELAADDAARAAVSPADLAWARTLALTALGPESAGPAVEQAALARAGYRADGDLRRYAVASLHHGRLLGAAGEVDAAAEALAEAGRHGHAEPVLRVAALATRGGLLARSERAEEAVDDLVEAVAGGVELGLPQVPYTRFDLAVALANTGRILDAAESAEEGLAVLELAEDDPDAAETVLSFRELLVRLYRQLGEKDNAVAHLEALARHFTEHGPPDAAARAGEEAGEVLDELDRDALAAERFGAAAEAYRLAGDPFGVARCGRRRALSLHWAGESDTALTVVEEVRRQIEALPAEDPAAVAWERAALDYNVARMLGGLGRFDEAAERARAAADGFHAAGHTDAAEAAEDLLDQLRERAAESPQGRPAP